MTVRCGKMILVRGFCFWNRMFRKHPKFKHTFHVTFTASWIYFWTLSVENTPQDVVYWIVLSFFFFILLFHVRLMHISSCNCSSLDYRSVGVCAGVCICKKTQFPIIVGSFSAHQWSPDVFTKARAVAAW